jgi:5-methylcytosine-specific restriction enzyme A
MSARALPEWIGRDASEPPPPRVRLRRFQKYSGVCPICHRNLRPGHWDLDHIKALKNGGENCESNLQPVCDVPCHAQKTKADVAEKSASYERQLSHVGIRKNRRPSFQTNRDATFKKKMNGEVVRRS